MKPPLTYYGGKQKLAKTINQLIPEHRIYVEPFFGGGAVFFAKNPSLLEVINDTNGELMNFYKVMKTKFTRLEKEISITLRSRDAYRKAKVIYHNPDMFDEIKRAWAVWTLANQCYASIIGSTWGYDLKNNSSAIRLQNKRRKFKAYMERMEKVQIECTDALELICQRDGKDTFFYLDPPYFNTDKGHYGNYTEQDYERLLVLLSSLKGKFLLSSYPSVILNQHVKKNKWFMKEMNMSLSVTARYNTRKTKTEVLVGNYGL
jgi:DNA adenine methylase